MGLTPQGKAELLFPGGGEVAAVGTPGTLSPQLWPQEISHGWWTFGGSLT